MKTLLVPLALACLLPAFAADALFAESPAVPGAKAGAPYIYLGHGTTARANITLRSALQEGSPVTTIPAQAPLTILLATPDKAHYLIKSDFGLVGWLAADAKPAADASDSEDFSTLKKLEIPRALNETTPFSLHYQPARINIVNPPVASNEDSWMLLEGRFAANDTIYRLECGPGMSADPYCELLDDADLKQRANGEYPMDKGFGGETFYFPGNGAIYGDTASNRMHRTRSKYRLDPQGTLSEVAQAYYYVGLSSSATRELALHAKAQADSAVIARVVPGERVEVLLSDTFLSRGDDDYRDYALVKNTAGQLGWLVTDLQENPYDSGIEDYRFHGD
ncbi:MAG: SH3 domain-containing protein [Cardiobacteriaceae bacterium]|nr:SH3 domain-containing protein [Cardiobacteriaceae bacterium]